MDKALASQARVQILLRPVVRLGYLPLYHKCMGGAGSECCKSCRLGYRIWYKLRKQQLIGFVGTSLRKAGLQMQMFYFLVHDA